MVEQYIDTPVGSLAPHNFLKLMEVNPYFVELPKKDISNEPFNYMLEVYIYDYIELAIPKRQYQLHHVANSIITGIHDVFSPYKDDKEDAISLKKFLKNQAAWSIIKNVLVFEFDRNAGGHTIWLTEERRTDILTKLKKCIR